MSRPDIAVLQDVRLSFPKLFKAEKSTDTSPPKFSAVFLIDPTTKVGKANIAAIENAIAHVRKTKWPGKSEKFFAAFDKDRIPLRVGDDQCNSEGEVWSGYEDMMSVHASSQQTRRPQVLGRDKRPLVEEDNVIYGGCYVDAVLSVYPIDDKDKGGNGIFASIEVVRFRRAGEPFGQGAVDADDYLDDLEDLDEDDNDLL